MLGTFPEATASAMWSTGSSSIGAKVMYYPVPIPLEALPFAPTCVSIKCVKLGLLYSMLLVRALLPIFVGDKDSVPDFCLDNLSLSIST